MQTKKGACDRRPFYRGKKLKSALTVAGVTTFAQFQNLRLRHFERMQYQEPGRTDYFLLPVWTAAHAVMCVAFYHWLRSKHIPKDDDLITPVFESECASFLNDFQTFYYDPDDTIVPWGRLKERGNEQEQKALETWNKNIRLSVPIAMALVALNIVV